MLKNNALNTSAFITLLLSTWILLTAEGLASAHTFSDSGAASIINIVILLCCFAYALWLGFSEFAGRRLDWIFLAFVFCVYALREADFHTIYTHKSLTQWQTYTLGDIPVLIKLCAAIIFLCLFMSLSYLMARYSANIVKALKQGYAWAISIAAWAILLGLSRLMHLYLSRTSKGTWQKHGIEEMLELSAAVFALLALIQFTNSYRDKYKDYFS